MDQELRQNATLQDGKYRILKVLGQGGFGITYLAENTFLEKNFALKEFFPKEYCGRDASANVTTSSEVQLRTVSKLKERFLKEAKNIAKIDFPGIVKIHDIFNENGTSYFVMEYIEGDNLNEIVKREGKLNENRALGYIEEVGKALDHIHSRNMIHFDIKPSNVMVRNHDDHPILIDFGLSKQYTVEGEATSTVLKGRSKGYSPIELYNDDENQVFSPQTDIYSLAATLYFLLEGQRPPSAMELIQYPLEFHSIKRENLKNGIIRAMSLRKEERPQNVEEFLNSIKTVTPHQNITTNNSKSLQNNKGKTVEKKKNDEETEVLKTEIHSSKRDDFIPDVTFPDQKLYQEAIEGDKYAQLSVGNRYYLGETVPLDYSKAKYWWGKAARQGEPVAQYQLGYLYTYGLGVEIDYKEAFKWYKKSADQNCGSALDSLGLAYEHGRAVERDYERALYYYRKAAEKGNAEAMNRTGDLYYYGKGVEQNYKKAYEWYLKAWKEGYSDSAYNIGHLYDSGLGMEKNEEKAFEWYSKAAELGHTIALNQMGICYYNGKGTTQDYDKALEYFQAAAKKGHPAAHSNIGEIYFSVMHNYSSALDWYRKASDLGDSRGDYNLGYMYINGKGVNGNPSVGYHLVKKAADNGLPEACDYLGNLYYLGLGVKKDSDSAKKYWKMAAEAGIHIAQKKIDSHWYRISKVSGSQRC